MREAIRVAVIGHGTVVRYVHAPAVERCGAELVAIVGRAPKRAEEAASALGARRWFIDVPSMVREVDPHVVVVATPDALHFTHACESLRRDRVVVVEKPAVTDLADGAELLRRARAAGAPVIVNMTLRYLPPFALLRAELAARRVAISAHVTYRVSPPEADWYFDDRSGGSSLRASVSIHPLDVFAYVAGQSLRTLRPQLERPRAEILSVLAEDGSGCVLSVDANSDDGLMANFRVQAERFIEVALGPGNSWSYVGARRACGPLWDDLVTCSAVREAVDIVEGKQQTTIAGLAEHLRLLGTLAGRGAGPANLGIVG